MKKKRPLAEIGAGEMRHAIFCTKALRLLAHVLDQLWSHDSLGETWEILHKRRHGELPAGFVPFHHQRLQVSASGVKRRGMSGASGPDDDNVASFAHCDFSGCKIRWLSSHFDAK